MQKPFWQYLSASLFSWEAPKLTWPGSKGTKKSSSTEKSKSNSSARKRPSLLLGLAFFFLAVSAFLSLAPEPSSPQLSLHPLTKKGWVVASTQPCPHLPLGFYEVEAGFETFEVLVAEEGVLSSLPPPWPAETLTCWPIQRPSLIQEIL